MLTVTTLASGSSGNCTLVSCGGTHILLDAGVSARRITTGLRALGVDPEELSAIFVTHEHHDHINGLQVLTKKLRVPVVSTAPTCREILAKAPNTDGLLRPQEAGAGLEVGRLWVESVPIPHDAAGPVCYTVTGGGCKMMLCTDLGYVTADVAKAAEGSDLIICEANHDADWVQNGPYPYQLKQRILGDHGHLCNEAGADLAIHGVAHGAKTVILAHLSAENNTPAHAYEAVCRRMRGAGLDPERDLSLSVAPRKEPGRSFRLEAGADPVPLEKECALC